MTIYACRVHETMEIQRLNNIVMRTSHNENSFKYDANKLKKISSCVLALCLSYTFVSNEVGAQVDIRGINTAPNLAGSFGGASLPRDSEFSEPLDLLNDFYPSVEVRLENHSNIRRRHDVSESDTKLIVEPVLAYRTSLGRHEFYAAYSGRFDRHQDITSEDSDSHNLDAKIGFDVSRRWDIDVFGAIGSAREERGVSGTRDFLIGVDGDLDINDGRDRIQYERYGADLIYGQKLNGLKAVLGFERGGSTFRSSNGDELLAGDRDRDTESIHFDIEYRLASQTAIFGRIERTTTDFDRSTGSLDNEQLDWLVGLRVKPTSRLSGVIGYGQSDRDFDDDSIGGFDGNTYYANVTYSIAPFSTIQFGAARSVEEPGSSDASFFVSELFSVSWDHALTQRLDFGAYAKAINDDFDNGREDDFFDWGLTLDYALRNWLTLGAYYEEIDRSSNFDGISYEDNIIGLRLKSDLRSFFSSRRDKHKVEPSSFKPTSRSQFTNINRQ